MSTTEDLEEELYCPICADLFDDPLMLPCTHSFCRKCLKERIRKGNVTRKSTSVLFDCPVCRREVTLDETGLASLPRNRLLKKMVDMFRSHTHTEKSNTQCVTVTEVCEDHKKELGAFCSVCREVVCIDCIVGEHRGHPIESVDDVYHKKRTCLERRKEELEKEMKTLCNIREEEFKYIDQLKENCKQKCECIEVQFDEYTELIQQSKDSVLAEIAARQGQELAKVRRVIATIRAREQELNENFVELKETIKLDKIKMLRESKLSDTSRLSLSTSSLGSDTSLSSTDALRSPRTRCFIDCSLELDCAALESAINNAHLIWEPSADMYSPKNLASKFNQLYEKEWKSAYLVSTSKTKDEIVTQLLNLLTDAYRHATLCSETHLESLTYHILQPDIDVHVGEFNIHGFNNIEPDDTQSATFCSMKEGLRKLRAHHAPDFVDDIAFMHVTPVVSMINMAVRRIICDSILEFDPQIQAKPNQIIQHDLTQLPASLGNGTGNHRQLSVYTNTCFEVAYSLRLQDPPLHVEIREHVEHGGEPIKDTYRFVKRRGRKTKTIAWPPLYLYKDGPLLSKGVVFIPG